MRIACVDMHIGNDIAATINAAVIQIKEAFGLAVTHHIIAINIRGTFA